MKCTVWGIGAIGASVAARLQVAGAEPTLIARPVAAEVIQREGLEWRTGDRSQTVHPRCVSDPCEAGIADVLFIAVKAHAAPSLMAQAHSVVGPDTVVVPLINGVPWWYFSPGDASGQPHGPLLTIDPEAVQWNTIGVERVLGAVVADSAHMASNRCVVQGGAGRIVVGEPNGQKTARVDAVAELLRRGGYEVVVTPDIRTSVWGKLLGNISTGPLCALTRSDIGTVLANPPLRAMARALIGETVAVAASLGVKIDVDPDKRLKQTQAVAGHHKPSMLQDVEARRRIEIEPMVGMVAELARRASVATPTLDTLLALTRALDASLV
jgi:2-dehydropantoate 2-reductase